MLEPGFSDWTRTVLYLLLMYINNILAPIPCPYLIQIKSYKDKRTLTLPVKRLMWRLTSEAW